MNARTKQMMRLNWSLMEDLEQNHERLSITRAASSIDIPFLIIHGKEDLSVDYSDAEKLYAAAGKDKTKLILLENTGHTFGVVHPFIGTTKTLEQVINLVKEFTF
jgi:esterase/lipase